MRQDWIWMPHAGHLIVSRDCIFHLNTYVNGFIISTVGEWWPDETIREIHASVQNVPLEGKGDDRARDFLQKFGYMEIGADRKYETMVFKAKKSEDDCCPYRQISGENLDMEGYNDPGEAYLGHLKMCEKYDR